MIVILEALGDSQILQSYPGTCYHIPYVKNNNDNGLKRVHSLALSDMSYND